MLFPVDPGSTQYHPRTLKRPWLSRRLGFFRVDMLLIVILLIGWSLIFTTAIFGSQRYPQRWLEVENLYPRISADYSRDTTTELKLARIKPQIIEAIKEDAKLVELPTAPIVAVMTEPTSTPTLTPTPTPTPLPLALVVSAGGPYEGEEGSSISLAAKHPNLLLGWTMTYRWDLDNDGRYDDAEGASTSVVFPDEGEYPIKVQVTDWLNRVATDTTVADVSNLPPVVFIGEDREANEGEEVIFLATADDPGQDVLLYEWDFGDGSSPVLDTLNPHHTYSDNGDYTVRLRVSDNDGGATEASLLVRVKNLPPLVEAGSDQIVDEGSEVTFNGTATDPGSLDTLTYAWDLNYDGANFTPDVLGPTASTIYPDGPANIVAAFRARDKDGAQAISTVNVRVNNVGPVITSVTHNGPVGEGSPVTLSVNATDVGNDPLTYAVDWENSGDFGNVDQPASVSHIWDDEGEYTVGVRVDDGDGGQSFTTVTLSVYNEPPVAVAGADVTAREGASVAFSGSSSSDPGSKDILTYLWDFGDGHTAEGREVTHTYSDNKVYNVTLTVTDDSDASSNDSTVATIQNANPTAQAGNDREIDEGANVSLAVAGTATDPGVADGLTYEWDFEYKGTNFNADASGAAVNWTYPNLDGPSDYVVALRVRDDDYPANGGEIGEQIDTFKVTVRNLPPRVDAGGPYTGVEAESVTLTGMAADVPLDVLTDDSYDWDLDSNPDFETHGREVSFIRGTAGVYTVRLRARDDDGGEAFDSAEITITNAPPQAVAGGPYQGPEGSPIIFDGSGSGDPTGDPLSYSWDFGDGSPITTTTNLTLTHLYTDDGVYTATLQVDDGRGGQDTDQAVVVIDNLPPVAIAAANPLTVTEGSSVAFDGSGSSDPNPLDTLTYQWDFGDGNTGSGISVTHTYADNNDYPVTLTVTDDEGAFNSASIEVRVLNANPTAQIIGPDNRTVDEGQQFELHGAGTDPGVNDTLTFEWDFNYDGSNFERDQTGRNVLHRYANGPVERTVALRVRDDDGGVSAIDTIQIIVNNVRPTANAGPDQTVNEGETVNLDGSGSSDPGVNDTLTYQWDFNYDGANFDVDANGPTASTTYPDPGNYTIALRVSDDDGASHIDTVQITVQNIPPTADAGPDVTVVEGEEVTFNGSGAGREPLLYEWDFDYDGTNFEVNDNTGSTVSTTYPDGPATYTVALRVMDRDGESVIDTLVVRVDNARPADVSAGGPYSTTAGTPVTLSGSAEDVSDDALTYDWDLDNDGIFETLGQQVVDYTWSVTGTYTIVLQVSDDDGASETSTTTVEVNSVLPFAWLSWPYLLTLKKRRTRWGVDLNEERAKIDCPG